MIDVFKTIASVGAGQAAELSNGISQALITTATGLLIAIPSLVGYNFFTSKADRIVTQLERESLRVLHRLHEVPESGTARVPAAVGLASGPAASEGEPAR